MNGGGDVVSQQDKTETERIQENYEIIQSDEEIDYDPSARLARYPGHFVPVRLSDLGYEVALVMMRRHVETIIEAQSNIRRLRQQLIQLFQLDREQLSQGTFSVLLLKGGGFDKFYGAVNAAILQRLTDKGHFEIFLGCRHEVSLDQALTRWNFLEQRVRDVVDRLNSRHIRTSDDGYARILGEVLYLMEIHDHWRLQGWLKQLDSERFESPIEVRQSISKALMFLKYVTTTSQYILIRRRSQREDIVRDWGLSYDDIEDGIDRASRNTFFDTTEIQHIERADFERRLGEILSYFDEQEFVKLILVGSAGEGTEQGNGIRSLVWNILRAKPYSWIKDLIEADLSIDDFASIVNGIHGPNGPRGNMEFQKEIMLLPIEDLMVFTSVLSTNLSGNLTPWN